MSWRQYLRPSLVAIGVIGICSVLWACSPYGKSELSVGTDQLVSQLGDYARDSEVSLDDPKVVVMINELRSREHSALTAMLEYRGHRMEDSRQLTDGPMMARFDQMLDRVAGQRFASSSRLYWHTSLERAAEESRERGVPILSLRMLGRLDEDLSCANSRYFRATLYPDPKISDRLRERFVLHWQSVRDVPVVTVDFGNGRLLRQPITGNSVHLMLNSIGQPIDAMPGLVTPEAFTQWLDGGSDLWQKLASEKDDVTYWSTVSQYHRTRAATRRQVTPMAVPLNQSIRNLDPLDRGWQQLAGLTKVNLSQESKRLVDELKPTAEEAMVLAPMKSVAEVPVLTQIQGVESYIGRDSVFNLYALQVKIDDWFANTPSVDRRAISYEALTNRIYSEVFLMPLDDPFLGLSPDQNYTLLEDGGRITQSETTETDQWKVAIQR